MIIDQKDIGLPDRCSEGFAPAADELRPAELSRRRFAADAERHLAEDGDAYPPAQVIVGDGGVRAWAFRGVSV